MRKLDLLREFEVISEIEHIELVTSYTFFRIIESRLVMVRRRPEENLPEDPLDREKLAWRMNYAGEAGRGWEALSEEMAYHMSVSRELFKKLVK